MKAPLGIYDARAHWVLTLNQLLFVCPPSTTSAIFDRLFIVPEVSRWIGEPEDKSADIPVAVLHLRQIYPVALRERYPRPDAIARLAPAGAKQNLSLRHRHLTSGKGRAAHLHGSGRQTVLLAGRPILAILLAGIAVNLTVL